MARCLHICVRFLSRWSRSELDRQQFFPNYRPIITFTRIDMICMQIGEQDIVHRFRLYTDSR